MFIVWDDRFGNRNVNLCLDVDDQPCTYFFDSLQIVLRYEPSDLLRRAPQPRAELPPSTGRGAPAKPEGTGAPAPRAAGPPASTTPSPKCALACGSTHQMTSPGTRVPSYRANIVRGISGGAAMPNTLMATSCQRCLKR